MTRAALDNYNEDVPALIARVRELEGALEELREIHERKLADARRFAGKSESLNLYWMGNAAAHETSIANIDVRLGREKERG